MAKSEKAEEITVATIDTFVKMLALAAVAGNLELSDLLNISASVHCHILSCMTHGDKIEKMFLEQTESLNQLIKSGFFCDCGGPHANSKK